MAALELKMPALARWLIYVLFFLGVYWFQIHSVHLNSSSRFIYQEF